MWDVRAGGSCSRAIGWASSRSTTPRRREGLAFASEVKSLLAGGLVEPALDPIAAELFLAYGYVPGPQTLFAGVRKLAPATYLVVEDGRIVEDDRILEPVDDLPPLERHAGRRTRSTCSSSFATRSARA